MVREGAAERPDERLLGFPVGLGNKIDGLVLRVTLTQLKRCKWMRPAARGTERHLLEAGGCRIGFRAHRG